LLENPQKGDYSPHIGYYGKVVMQIYSIGDALFTKTQQKVLGLLFGKPDKSFYTNEIMRWAAMGRGTVSRELERLVGAGLLTATKEGNQNHYQANANSPVYSELVSIVKKTFGVADEIRARLKPLDENIELAFIYGSISKGTETAISDVDLMLVGKALNYSDVMDLLVPSEELLQRTINPTIYSKADFSKKLREGNSFITRVMEQPKILIKGVINDVRKSGKD
jgi:predicted nucleotidyltransferase